MWTRRHILQSLAGGLTVGALPGVAHAEPQPGHKFVFVFVRGGWDTTRVHTPSALNSTALVEPESSVESFYGLDIITHPDRQPVDEFFRLHGHRTSIVDGMLVRSVNHKVCERLVLTGSSRVGSPDWPSILGSAWADRMPVPNLVLDGPSEAGPLSRYTSIAGGRDQLQNLLRSELRLAGDQEPDAFKSYLEGPVDRLVRARAAAQLDKAASPVERRMLEAWVDGHDRALDLRDQTTDLTITSGIFRNQADTAVTLLEAGVARCVCISLAGWDTHSLNTTEQTRQYNILFAGLNSLMFSLDDAQGHDGPLSGETTVVVLSEMGRAPYANAKDGKDHWPYTAAMLMGAGIFGARRIGAVDQVLNGRKVNMRTGAFEDTGTYLRPDHIGATLMTLAGVDSETWLPGVEPLRFVMA